MDAQHTPGLIKHQALMGAITVGFRDEAIFHCGLGLRQNNLLPEQEQNARRLVACWNACDGIPTYQLLGDGGAPNNLGKMIDTLRSERDHLIAQDRDTVGMVEWLERAHTLHRKAEMLYVVDGWEVTMTWDGNPISEDFHGETLQDAILKAMDSFDLDVRHPYADREDLSQQERQINALAVQNAELLDALKRAQEKLTSASHPDTHERAMSHLVDEAMEIIGKATGGAA